MATAPGTGRKIRRSEVVRKAGEVCQRAVQSPQRTNPHRVHFGSDGQLTRYSAEFVVDGGTLVVRVGRTMADGEFVVLDTHGFAITKDGSNSSAIGNHIANTFIERGIPVAA